MTSSGLQETGDERRLRHAACLLADIGWRGHPDYRGEQSLSLIADSAFSGIDHADRAFMALAVFYRYSGLLDDHLSPRIRELATTRALDRARVLGGAFRVAYVISGAMPGVLEHAVMRVEERTLVLHLPGRLRPLAGARVMSRLKALAKLIGRKARVETSGG